MDCGDSSCEFAVHRGGMRTNGGCHCLMDLPSAQRMAARVYILGLRAKLDAVRAECNRTNDGYEEWANAVKWCGANEVANAILAILDGAK